MITSVLFVDSDAEALARIKAAIEQAGDYEAKVFVTGKAALEYASRHPPALAVISLNVTDISPVVLAETLRHIRPGLPLLLRVPDEADEQDTGAIGPNAVVRGPYTARTLLPLLEEASRSGPSQEGEIATAAAEPPEEGLPSAAPPEQEDAQEEHDTRSVPTVDSPAMRQYLATADPHDDAATFGEVLESLEPDMADQQDDTFKALVDSLRAPVEKTSLPERQRRPLARLSERATAPDEDNTPPPTEAPAESEDVFARLAAEEPPLPALEDTGTVRDLMGIANPNFTAEPPPDGVDIPDDMFPDASELPLSEAERELLRELAAAGPPKAESRQQGRETQELPDEKLIPMPEPLKNRLETGDPVPQELPGSSSVAPRPEASGPQDAPEGQTDAATLAVQLTQHTLESLAQATMLLRDGKIVASAGALPEDDVEALAAMIDCAAVLQDGGIKMRFLSLPQTRTNYMVVSTPTVEDMVLAMVFTEDVHLRNVRQQTREMLQALMVAARQEEETPPAGPEDTASLQAAPAADAETGVEAAPEPAQAEGAPPPAGEAADQPAQAQEAAAPGNHEAAKAAPAVDPETLVKYACVWLLRDPQAALDSELIQALPDWLEASITARQWLAEQVDVQPTYISVVVSIPPGEAPSEIVQALMTETAERILTARPILAAGASELWADAYYVVAPGRPLSQDEIEDFISYQRKH